MVKFLCFFIGDAKNTVAMCKTLMHDVAEAVTAYAMRDLKKKTEMIRWEEPSYVRENAGDPGPG